ncbi:hypothetical protein U1Q18_035184, partial [Sarracenia purpurea var. burkii]
LLYCYLCCLCLLPCLGVPRPWGSSFSAIWFLPLGFVSCFASVWFCFGALCFGLLLCICSSAHICFGVLLFQFLCFGAFAVASCWFFALVPCLSCACVVVWPELGALGSYALWSVLQWPPRAEIKRFISDATTSLLKLSQGSELAGL